MCGVSVADVVFVFGDVRKAAVELGDRVQRRGDG